MKIAEFVKQAKEKAKKIEKLIDKFRKENNIKPLICPHFGFDIFSNKYPVEISIYFDPYEEQKIIHNIDDVVAIKADTKARKVYPDHIEKIINFIKGVEI